MRRRELAEAILQELLDEQMIILEYCPEFWEDGRQDCINLIEKRLSNFTIVAGELVC